MFDLGTSIRNGHESGANEPADAPPLETAESPFGADDSALSGESIQATSILSGSKTLELSTATLVEQGLLPVITIAATDIEAAGKDAHHPTRSQSESTDFFDWIGDSVVDLFASPEENEIFSQFDSLASRCGVEPLTNAQKLDIINMEDGMQQMFRLTVSELEKLENGEIGPADYMSQGLLRAARLAEENGTPCWSIDESSGMSYCPHSRGNWSLFGPTANELFRDYIAMAYAGETIGFLGDVVRDGIGDGPHHSGQALEWMYKSIVAEAGDQGFNTNITDIDSRSTISHHFREFLGVGFESSQILGNFIAKVIDDPSVNPGDVRSGYFASMLGAALFSGQITPTEAANLTIWAYTSHDGDQPPWGAVAEQGRFLDTADYDIERWLDAFNNSGFGS